MNDVKRSIAIRLRFQVVNGMQGVVVHDIDMYAA